MVKKDLKLVSYYSLILFLVLLLTSGCSSLSDSISDQNSTYSSNQSSPIAVDLASIPAYSGSPYVEINNNVPYFSEDEITTQSYEFYSDLDSLGRVGYAEACVGTDLMPTEERGNISEVKPTGWHSSQYDFVNGKNLYNRCHLIAFQLTGENANAQNLMTGTRYLNVDGMLPFENMVANYVRSGGHVMYRVTPVFTDTNLVADGIELEGYSVEDQGQSVQFNVFCYNVQPGIEINYQNGDNWIANEQVSNTETTETTYILNTNSKKFHTLDCPSVSRISEKNKQEYSGPREALLVEYEACQICNP